MFLIPMKVAILGMRHFQTKHQSSMSICSPSLLDRGNVYIDVEHQPFPDDFPFPDGFSTSKRLPTR